MYARVALTIQKEGRRGYIILPETPDVIKAMLQFMYHSTIEEPANQSNNALEIVQLCVAADKYLVEPLKLVCLDKLHNMRMDSRSLESVVDFLYSEDTPQEIRDPVICGFHDSITGLFNIATPVLRDYYRNNILCKYPTFAIDVRMRCQNRIHIRCTFRGGLAQISKCPRGDRHSCRGICADIDVSTVPCECGARGRLVCMTCRGDRWTPVRLLPCCGCRGAGFKGRPNPANTAERKGIFATKISHATGMKASIRMMWQAHSSMGQRDSVAVLGRWVHIQCRALPILLPEMLSGCMSVPCSRS